MDLVNIIFRDFCKKGRFQMASFLRILYGVRCSDLPLSDDC